MNSFKSPLLYLLIVYILGFNPHILAQVAINETGSQANSKSILDISSSTKGLLIPRMSTSERSTFSSGLGTGERSMLVFDTDESKYYFWDGASFIAINSGNLDKLQDDNGDSEIALATLNGGDIAIIKLENTDYFRFRKGGIEFLNNGNSVFIGENSGENDDRISNYNTFVGYQNGQGNTSGFRNTAIGASSLKSNIGGSLNLALGCSVLYKNTSGYNNIGIGYQAMYNNLTSSGNMAVGNYGLYSLTNGIENIAIGSNALKTMTNGYYNTVVGNAAGFNNNNGNYNTLIGFEAGRGNLAHNSNGNVFLGFKAGYFETGDNKLYIENSNSTTPLIGGDFSTDEVQINGTLKITGGNPGENKFLKSDIDGNASWGNVDLNSIDNVISDDTSIFIGHEAGINDNGGTYSIGLGWNALQQNSTGTHNIAIGKSAMLQNSTGADNIAIGTMALTSATNTTANTALGHYTMIYTTASFNVALGDYSSFNNTIGAKNVSIGFMANSNNQTGSNNTIIGYNAGKGSSVHSNSGNIFLGFEAGFNETGSNKLYIENSNSATPLIGGDFSADEVYINGTIKITGGGPGDGKILTSDTNGNASWQTNDYPTELNDLSDAIYDGSNFFVGDQAGVLTGTNNFNAGFGKDALTSNTSGKFNTALGTRPMFRSTTSDNNTAVGYNPLYNNTTGASNTAIGSTALFNSNGSENTAVGFETLYTNSSGTKNTGIGVQSLYGNTTGNYNSAFGYKALNTNTTGYKNTVIGSESLIENTTGSQNVAIGTSAGSFGNNSKCTYVGVDAMNTDHSSWLNSTALGFGVSITASNQVRIGNTSVTSIGGYTDWTNISDKRFKSNIAEDVKGLDFILKLRPVSYNLDIDKINTFLNIEEYDKASASKKSSQRQTGFIAQEVEEAANELNFEFSGIDKPKNNNDHYGLRYSQFVVPLVKAVQEQEKKITSLKSENAELKARLEILEQKMKKLLVE